MFVQYLSRILYSLHQNCKFNYISMTSQAQTRRQIMNMLNESQFRRALNYHNSEICTTCGLIYNGSHQCLIACAYCHEFHLKKDFIDTICPVVYLYAKKEQVKKSFQCKNCHGEGSYAEQVKTVKYESNQKYEERLKEWTEMLALQQNNTQQMPARRILYSGNIIKDVQCSQCHGKGRIMRFLVCCSEGCNICKGQGLVINPMWLKYKKQLTISENSFQCPICLMNVQKSEEKYAMSCQHEFHSACINRLKNNKKGCPVCNQHDCFIEGVSSSGNQIEENDFEDSFQQINRLRREIQRNESDSDVIYIP